MTKPTWVKLLFATTALAGLGLPSLAWAQEQPAAPPPAQPPAEEDEEFFEEEEVDVSAPGAGGLGDEIVVVGRRIPNVVRSTPSVVSVLSATDMARTGEGDIAGALARVTGLSVVGGKFVYVRGLGERYSLALLNGLPIPSPEPQKRVVPLDIFPTDILASTLVQKSFSPNFPGEFGGGVINLTTRAVPDEPFFNVTGSISGDTVTTGQLGYTYWGSRSDWTSFDSGTRSNPAPFQAALNRGVPISQPNFTLDELKTITSSLNNADTNLIQSNANIPANMSLGFTGGTAWDIGDDRLGVIATANWSNNWLTRGGVRQATLLVQEGGLVPDQDFRFLSTENRIQLNGLLGIGYEFGEHQLRFTNLYIRDVLKQARIEAGTDELNAPGVELNRGITNWFERQLFSSSLVGEFDFGDFDLDVRGTYAQSRRDAPYERENAYQFRPELNGFVNSLRGRSGESSTVTFSNLKDTIWAGAADLACSLSTERPVTISGGYAYSDNSRDSVRREFAFLAQDELPVGVIQQRPDYLLSQFNINTYDIVLQERSGLEGAARYDAGLEVHGAYGMVEAELFDGFRVSGGVRFESGKQNVRTLTLAGDVASETRLENDYWLPALTLTWNFAENMQGRVAASKTIARPQFRELAPQQYTDTDNDRTSFGNPFLVDSELLNLEARYEWYFARDQRLVVGAFWKEIDKPIETVAFSSGGGDILTTFANAPKAELYGLEVEAVKFFTLSDEGFFSDRQLFVSANYTFTDSKIKVTDSDTTIPVDSGGAERPASLFFIDGDPLTGQSDHIVNLQIGFQRDEKLSEQTILLTYASERVTQRGPNDTPDYIERPGVLLDFVMREEVNIGTLPLELKFEVRNILGTEYRESQSLNDSEIFNNRYDRGTSFSLGLTAKF